MTTALLRGAALGLIAGGIQAVVVGMLTGLSLLPAVGAAAIYWGCRGWDRARA